MAYALIQIGYQHSATNELYFGRAFYATMPANYPLLTIQIVSYLKTLAMPCLLSFGHNILDKLHSQSGMSNSMVSGDHFALWYCQLILRLFGGSGAGLLCAWAAGCCGAGRIWQDALGLGFKTYWLVVLLKCLIRRRLVRNDNFLMMCNRFGRKGQARFCGLMKVDQGVSFRLST